MENLTVFDSTLQKTYEMIDDVSIEAKLHDREAAFKALRGTLLALRDRLPVDQATHIGAQLPVLLRGFYYEGWKPSAVPNKDRTQEEFLDHIRNFLSDKEPDLNAQHVAQSVFSVLGNYISDGEVEDILKALPEELRDLWPQNLEDVI